MDCYWREVHVHTSNRFFYCQSLTTPGCLVQIPQQYTPKNGGEKETNREKSTLHCLDVRGIWASRLLLKEWNLAMRQLNNNTFNHP